MLAFWPKAFLLATVCCLASGSWAQQFKPAVYYQTVPAQATGSQIVAADFNNDGKLDLASAFYNPSGNVNGVAISLGVGDGTFRPARDIASPLPLALATADVNGDGNNDLLVLSAGYPGQLQILLGKGDGSFVRGPAYTLQDDPIAMAVADFNGDGHLDVAIAVSNQGMHASGYVSILFGTGTGRFKLAKATYLAGSHPRSIVSFDISGSGHSHIAVSDDNSFGGAGNTLYILLNNGRGSFHPGESFQTGIESVDVSVGDLNHDGTPDLIVASAFDRGIYVLLGSGGGNFSAPIFYSTFTNPPGNAPQAVATADFNLDGIPDIFVFDYDNNASVVLYGNGDGTFQAPTVVLVNGGGSVAVGDFNGDGATDVATLNLFNTGVLINSQ